MHPLLLGLLFACATPFVGQTAPPPSPKIVVEDISITNDSLVSSQHLQQLLREMANQQFDDNSDDEIASRAKYELQREGYFKANVTTSDIQVMRETPTQKLVAVTLRIDEGRQYRLQQIKFDGNRVFTSSQLRQAFAIKDQGVFDTEEIRTGLEELRRLYASKGYINFTPVPNTESDDQVQTVVLSVDIDEGKQFKIGSLMVGGNWPEGDQEKLAGIAHSYAGGFDVSGLIEQLKAATLAMFPGLASADGLVEVRQNVETATVEVSIKRPALDYGIK